MPLNPLDWEGISGRIKEIRGETQLNQTEFGKKLGGYPQVDISKFERGARKPPLEFLVKVAEFGDVSLNWLILGREKI